MSSCVSSGDLVFDKLKAGDEIPTTPGKLDHKEWNDLLQKHVDQNGFVDYEGFKSDESMLDNYLSKIGKNAPGKLTKVNEQFAYYINLYNAATIKIMLENDIPASIKDIGSTVQPVWIQDFIEVDGSTYSLADIEKGVLQKMGDPRIHFAINCASYSCPKLQNVAFTAGNVDELMAISAREFINSDKNNLADSSQPKLSRIFKWYEADFTATGKTVIEYINQYAVDEIEENASIEYLEYDWSRNSKR